MAGTNLDFYTQEVNWRRTSKRLIISNPSNAKLSNRNLHPQFCVPCKETLAVSLLLSLMKFLSRLCGTIFPKEGQGCKQWKIVQTGIYTTGRKACDLPDSTQSSGPACIPHQLAPCRFSSRCRPCCCWCRWKLGVPILGSSCSTSQGWKEALAVDGAPPSLGKTSTCGNTVSSCGRTRDGSTRDYRATSLALF